MVHRSTICEAMRSDDLAGAEAALENAAFGQDAKAGFWRSDG